MKNQHQAKSSKGDGTASSAVKKTSRRRMLLPFVLLALTLLLTACGWQGKGTVVEKEMHDGYWYSTSYCAAYDAKGICTMTMQQQNYMSETYYLHIKDDSGEVHEVSVNKRYWEDANKGDSFDNTEQ